MTKIAIRMMLETTSSPGLKIGERVARWEGAIFSAVGDDGGRWSRQPIGRGFGAVTVARLGCDVVMEVDVSWVSVTAGRGG